MHNFRSRRLHENLPLQFEEEDHLEPKILSFGTALPQSAPAARPLGTQRQPRRASPPIQQQALGFPIVQRQIEGFLALPVAPFRLRFIGHGIDFALSLAALLVFLAPLKLVAGPVPINRILLLGALCAYLLLVFLYGGLFLFLAGATPTMKWIGLRLVNFDGMPPPRHQLFWRFLGSIASVGSFFLGFLWAAVDEEKLSWHDRISKTFLTTTHR